MKNPIIPNRLRRVRRDCDLTQAQVAERLGISRSTFASWEAGTRTPTANELAVFCREFAVTFDYMCGRSEDSKRVSGEEENEINLARLTPLGRRILLFIYRAFLKNPEYAYQDYQN